MRQHTILRAILLLGMMTSVLASIAQQETEGECMNSLKLDLAGYPLSYLYALDHHEFVRYSFEYERKLHRDSRFSGTVDIELATWDDDFFAMRDGQVLRFGNLQKDLSLFAGLRMHLFYERLGRLRRLLFVEPRMGLVRSYAFVPVYDFGPDEYTFDVRKWYATPRIRGGLSVPVSRHFGFEVSDDLGLRSILGSGKKRLVQVFELNLNISF
ncbi:MAG: hypothetical protein U0176_20300 [Bacteroidia bacterium]